jgi:hypothetical protein
VKRALIVILSLFVVSCFVAVGLRLAGTPKPVPPAGRIGGSAAAGGGIPATGPVSSPVAGPAAKLLKCQSSCQTDSVACQSGCGIQYSASTQTTSWNQCIQTCTSKLNACANGCIASPAP